MFSQTHEFRQYLKRRQDSIDLEQPKASQTSSLFNERTFYKAFVKDLLEAKKEVIIYSPFVSKFRMDYFKPTIEKLRRRNIEIFIFTRPVEEHESILQPQIECALKRCEELGVSIFYLTGSIHEKVAIIDRKVLWEGSLNILSQRASKEIMRRTDHPDLAMQMLHYLDLGKKLAEEYKLKYEKLYRSLMANSRQCFQSKIRIFAFGIAAPLAIWLFIHFVGMISSFGGIKLISSIFKLFALN